MLFSQAILIQLTFYTMNIFSLQKKQMKLVKSNLKCDLYSHVNNFSNHNIPNLLKLFV